MFCIANDIVVVAVKNEINVLFCVRGRFAPILNNLYVFKNMKLLWLFFIASLLKKNFLLLAVLQ